MIHCPRAQPGASTSSAVSSSSASSFGRACRTMSHGAASRSCSSDSGCGLLRCLRMHGGVRSQGALHSCHKESALGCSSAPAGAAGCKGQRVGLLRLLPPLDRGCRSITWYTQQSCQKPHLLQDPIWDPLALEAGLHLHYALLHHPVEEALPVASFVQAGMSYRLCPSGCSMMKMGQLPGRQGSAQTAIPQPERYPPSCASLVAALLDAPPAPPAFPIKQH